MFYHCHKPGRTIPQSQYNVKCCSNSDRFLVAKQLQTIYGTMPYTMGAPNVEQQCGHIAVMSNMNITWWQYWVNMYLDKEYNRNTYMPYSLVYNNFFYEIQIYWVKIYCIPLTYKILFIFTFSTIKYISTWLYPNGLLSQYQIYKNIFFLFHSKITHHNYHVISDENTNFLRHKRNIT